MAIGQDLNTQSPNLFKFMTASTVSYLAALLLCASFFLQGVNYAQAETLEGTDTASAEPQEVSAPEPEPEPEPQEELVSEPDIVEEEVDSTPEVETVDSEIVTASDEPEDAFDTAPSEEEILKSEETAPSTTDETEEVTDEVEEGSGQTESESDAVTEEVGVDESISESEEVIDTDTDTTTTDDVIEDEEPATTDDSVEQTDEQTETASSTELVEEELPGTTESVSVVQTDTAYTFNQEECTKLATGSYYCLKPVVDMLEDALFAAPDEDGDLEIFLVRGGVQSQVTSNQVDDAAPYFDENSNTIVWHRLHNDRFQIVSYEIDSGDETMLTNTSENNMEPTRQGDYTVWQRWVDGYWNIILHDGQRETKITNNGGHNVAPYVHGSLVVWNRHSSDGQKTIEMYDVDTRSYVSVPDAEGLSVSNPRMVFVFDSLTPEGDIITKGYDVLSRKFIDLDSLPVNLPDEIPNSDSTGETRALIQSKPTVKTDIEELTEPEIDVPTTGPMPEPELEALTLDLSTTTTEVATSSTPEIVETMAEYELVIEPYNGTTTSSSSEQTNQ
ncbi:hypothetical protein A3I99_03060 [Candidatus Kaiserbacteria bacterium RIFCSPLOWO2_02_FULL_45_11b]|uniref:Uncharacterized protein n=1 Tax=Candidatus Kaiserbacteria bacterium RIFCSPLOWO2_12_FULL_45_26 TaxID=1798525 RepID=A0A1F6FGP5_9BACT|nr:MAG: hypothetical protein A2929_00715 [Candidatus Kaiserbacteria bacterium RIFCSPLOWO2_01_FULL_45_25]OGG81731.1 MAG: hypothetical protein A3I99_03060 [Candidatus Kaiserbacteria bacterium RIFCSPLOWO2_02_FULL_45_11b]OGG85028.1 MAG: hypothetical protein A3G90_03115 [Candidatus Kaiserbacteria bacterium RIFCSPLOWO2_12_FULL_45_26]